MKRRTPKKRFIIGLIKRMEVCLVEALQDKVIGFLDYGTPSILIKDKKYKKLSKEDISQAVDIFVRWYKLYGKFPVKRVTYNVRFPDTKDAVRTITFYI